MAAFVSLLIPRKIVKDVGLPIKDFLFGPMIGNIQEEYHKNIHVILKIRVLLYMNQHPTREPILLVIAFHV